MNSARKIVWCVLFIFICSSCVAAKEVHHYVFFNIGRQKISEPSFIDTKSFEGAQLKYRWRELEPEKDSYDFSAIRKDFTFLTSKGKKLFIQLQDVSFDQGVEGICNGLSQS